SGPPGAIGQTVEDHPADVVASLGVLLAWVPEADDDLVDGDDVLRPRIMPGTANRPGTTSSGAQRDGSGSSGHADMYRWSPNGWTPAGRERRLALAPPGNPSLERRGGSRASRGRIGMER